MSDSILIAPYGVNSNGDVNLPNNTQQRILDWVDAKRAEKDRSSIAVLYLRGGVGSGKTRGILAPIIEMHLEIAGLRSLWGRNDFKDLKLSVMDKFFEIFPSQLIINKSEQYHWYDIAVRGDNQQPSRLYFNGLKDLSGLGSQEFGVIAVTEAHEISEMAYRALKRRCRQEGKPGIILLESEPPNEDHWLSRLTNPADDSYDRDIETWELSTYENWDNLPLSYRGSLESMPKAWQRKYLYGKCGFIPDGRPFYEGFKEQFHVTDLVFNSARELILSWDFGYHHPAVTFHQLDESYWNILKELMGNETTIQHFCEQVKAFLNTHFPNAMIRNYGDPACLQTNDKSEKTSWQICKEHGFDIVCNQSTYRQRKEIIDRKLSTIINGKPALRVDRSCKIVIDGFLGGYHYPERKQGQANVQRFEEPFKDGYYEHPMNTVEYFAINTFRAVERHVDDEARARLRNRFAVKTVNAGFSFAR